LEFASYSRVVSAKRLGCNGKAGLMCDVRGGHAKRAATARELGIRTFGC
jgi:hypothetical protein